MNRFINPTILGSIILGFVNGLGIGMVYAPKRAESMMIFNAVLV